MKSARGSLSCQALGCKHHACGPQAAEGYGRRVCGFIFTAALGEGSGGAGVRLCLRGTAAPTMLPALLGLSHGGVGRARVIFA